MKYTNEKSHVFVVGFPRSGTTLLKRLIESHSSFVVEGSKIGNMIYSPETHLFFRVYQYSLAFDKWDENIVRFFNDPEALVRFKNSCKYILFFQRYFLCKIFRYRHLSAVLDRIGSEAICHLLRLCYYLASLNKAVIDRYFYHVAIARNGKRVVEKTPNHYLFVSEILYSFATAKIIFISRHPVDVYSSFMKIAQIDRFRSWSEISIAAFCKKYRECYKAISWYLQRKPGSIISLKYEQLVQTPLAAFKRVCSFLGENFEQNCLSGDSSPAEPEGNPNILKDIIRNTKDWRDYISVEEAGQIEDLLIDILSTYQYKPYTKIG